MTLAFGLNLVLLGTLGRGTSDGTSDSCCPLCIPCIYRWHYPSCSCVSWTALDTSSVGLRPHFKHLNLLLRPVYLSLSILKRLLGSSGARSGARSWGLSSRWTSRPPLPSPWVHTPLATVTSLPSGPSQLGLHSGLFSSAPTGFPSFAL